MKTVFNKILLLAILVVCSIFTAQAQYVAIPDANFRAFLQTQYPGCFNGQGQMDTTCTAVVTAIDIYCDNYGITNFQGLQYFDGLQMFLCRQNQLTNLSALPLALRVLDCSDNQLASLPALPASLESLKCNNNQFASLPALPASLQTLECYRNQILTLPVLPSSLTTLQCSFNRLTNLVLPADLLSLDCSNNPIVSLPTLPINLTYLYCQNNLLTNLPALPPSLYHLICGGNQLTIIPTLPFSLNSLNCGRNLLAVLPTLPSNLEYLSCDVNQLTNLPVLPNFLKELGCNSNQLTNLPALPNTLRKLYCSDNQITSLPPLPSSIKSLAVSENNLISLPALPSVLEDFYCHENPLLTCLPMLPNTLIYMLAQNTQITCIPNIPQGIAGSNTLPLCTPNNPNGCPFSARISGNAYTDMDNTCTVTGSDNLEQNLLVKAVNTTTQETHVGTSNASGLYEISVPIGTYSVSIVPPSAYWSACSGVQTVAITQNGQQQQRDVLVQPIVQCADIEVDHQIQNRARPCSTAVYKVAYFNSGTIPSAGAFAKITLPTELTLTSMTRPYTALGGGVFEVQLPSIGALERDTFSLSANVSCSAVMNQMLCTEVIILPNTYCSAAFSGWDGSNIELSGRCIGQDSVRFMITNTGNGGMATGRTYGIIEDHVMIRSSTFQLPAGATDSITVAADPLKIYRMIAAEAPSNPNGNTQETFLVWGCHGVNPQIHWGFVNQFGLNNGSQNPHRVCTPVRTSFDPNDIWATPEGVGTQNLILKGTDLEYKIRFQNTGNDTAFVVRIIDKIPAQLDLTTLRIGAASHPMTYSLKANGTLEFLFQNILLPDSTTNEPKSHGFVIYKIKAFNNLSNGTTINNQAFIYFDANTPIATNIYRHTIGENLSTIFITTIEVIDNQAFSVKIMPNPMRDAAEIRLQSYRHLQGVGNLTPELTLYNTLGQAVKTQRFIDGKLILERDNLPQGCYFYSIINEGKMMAQGKIVVAPYSH